MVKVLVVCGAGLGSSFACQMSTEDVLQEHNMVVDIDHADISSAVSMNADIIITGENFRSQFENYSIDEKETQIVYLRNIVSKVEIAEKVIPAIKSRMK